MHRIIFILFLLISFGEVAANEDKIVLTDDSIGEMQISSGMPISLLKIRNHFPYYRITHELREGNSPDYHLFDISTHEGEQLFSFISYINTPEDYELGLVKLNEIVVHSPTVKDEYGVETGMSIAEALKKRKELKFGAAHMDNYLGKGKIWYIFNVDGEHGEQVSRESALKANSKITSMTWPYPRAD